MTTWKKDELDRIGSALEMQIAPLRRDGTRHNPVTIWVVRVGDDLYIRSYRGPSGSWFREALMSHAGLIHAAGFEKTVTLVAETDPSINQQVDGAYRAKYGHSQYMSAMVASDVRSTTLKLIPG